MDDRRLTRTATIAIQLIWSPSVPAQIHTEHASTTAHAALIPPRQTHSFDSGGADIAILLIEPSGLLGQQLTALANELAASDVEVRLAGIRLPPSGDGAEAISWSRDLLSALTGDDSPNGPSHVRPEVLDAIDFIDAHLDQTPLLTAAARDVGLSSRQLRRSFTSDIGIPFRRYALADFAGP